MDGHFNLLYWWSQDKIGRISNAPYIKIVAFYYALSKSMLIYIVCVMYMSTNYSYLLNNYQINNLVVLYIFCDPVCKQ